LGGGITFALALLVWASPQGLTRLEHTVLDAQIRLRGERAVGPNITLVLVDEKSLKEAGRWPWSRDRQAQLVGAIAADGAKAIGLDIIYAEPEATPSLAVLNDILSRASADRSVPASFRNLLSRQIARADPDRAFVRGLQQSKNVILATPFFVPAAGALRPEEFPLIPQASTLLRKNEFRLVRRAKSGGELSPYEATAALPPLKQFVDAAAGIGHVYRLPDEDGVTRREYLALKFDEAYYPSFALEVARIALDVPRERMALLLGEGVYLNDVKIPTDQKSRMIIDYVGRELRFPWVSATDVLHGRVARGTFSGRVVLVGTGALGTYDQLTTPFSANFPGVEKNATVVDNIIHGNFLQAGLWSDPVEVAALVLLGLSLTYLLPRLRVLYGTALAGAALLGYAGLSQYLFVSHHLVIPTFAPLLAIVLVFMSTTVLTFVVREKQAKIVQDMFSSYVSPKIVAELIRSPAAARLGGQRKDVTMLFSDLVGFTTFSEGREAEAVVAQLNEYLGAMTDVIFAWNGTLDKFVGDEVVVFWGAPVDQPDHAVLAVGCALDMRRRLAELQAKWKAEGSPVLDHGIGINTGMALIGNIGAEGRKMDYTMIGDQVNLAARFQSLTRTFGHPILLTASTAHRIKPMIGGQQAGTPAGPLGPVLLRCLGPVNVKGKDRTTEAYAITPLEPGMLSRVEESPMGEKRAQAGAA
jgi:adenylate cyclase